MKACRCVHECACVRAFGLAGMPAPMPRPRLHASVHALTNPEVDSGMCVMHACGLAYVSCLLAWSVCVCLMHACMCVCLMCVCVCLCSRVCGQKPACSDCGVQQFKRSCMLACVSCRFAYVCDVCVCVCLLGVCEYVLVRLFSAVAVYLK